MNFTFKQRVLNPDEDKENTKAIIAHVLPFIAWLTMMVWFDDPAWNYNARTIGGIILLAIYRPWRWYSPLRVKNIPIAFLAGILVFILWVGFESPWITQSFPYISEWYDRLFVDLTQPFKVRDLYDRGDGIMVPYMVIEKGPFTGLHDYNPLVSGWVNFTIHMIGTSVIIAIIEEFFYRSFMYRWMQGSPFLEIDPGNLHWPLLIIISLFFCISHLEWGVAILCGIIFGLLYIKTKDIWAAIIAHGTTNFLLGLYVVKYDAYQFW